MDRVRVQFDMSAVAVARLDAMADDTGAATRAEVVRKALALYDRLLQAEDAGGEVRIRRPDGETVVLPVRGW